MKAKTKNEKTKVKDTKKKTKDTEKKTKDTKKKGKDTEVKAKETKIKVKETKIKVKEPEIKTKEAEIKSREMETKANVLGLDGKIIKEIPLPTVFQTIYRPDIIKRAVLASQANRKQPQGRDPRAGCRNTAVSRGVGHHKARVPRSKASGTRKADHGAFVSMAVGGRVAFPPKVIKKIKEKINKKERSYARASAIAATANEKLVRLRGHQFEENVKLPLVVSDSLEEVSKTNEIIEILKVLGVYPDILRASKRKIRAGKGKMRGRRYKKRKSILIVTSNLEKKILKSARNIPGLNVHYINYLSTEKLAPGGHAGRLTIWTESAIAKLK